MESIEIVEERIMCKNGEVRLPGRKEITHFKMVKRLVSPIYKIVVGCRRFNNIVVED